MTYSTHPAFGTSYINKQMFGWLPKEPKQFSLVLDGCQRFTFEPKGNEVVWTRHARNGYKQGAWQLTGKDTLTLDQGRQQWKRLIKLGAIKTK